MTLALRLMLPSPEAEEGEYWPGSELIACSVRDYREGLAGRAWHAQ
jgi:hypothetical protein